MNGNDVILILFLFRVALPVFILLSIGEWNRHREMHYWSRS